MRNIKGHKASKIQETTKVVEHVLQRDENIHRKKRDTTECAEDEEAQSANEEIQRIVGRSFKLKDLTVDVAQQRVKWKRLIKTAILLEWEKLYRSPFNFFNP